MSELIGGNKRRLESDNRCRGDMSEEYWQMKKHGYVNLDDYHRKEENGESVRQKFWVMKRSCLIIILIGDIKG